MVSDPDWNRVGVVPPDHHLSALGDATRWGAQVTQHMNALDGVFLGGELRSEQILSAQCRDQYPRPWTVIGTVSAPPFAWLLPDGVGPELWASWLVVTMGLGQAQLVHTFNLRAIVNADAPFYQIMDGFRPIPSAFSPAEVRPFIIPGGLVGRTVNMTVINTLLTGTIQPAFDFLITLMITPFAPGVEAPNQ